MFWSPSLGLEACQSCWRRLGDRHLGGVRVAILQRGDVPGALEPAKLLLWVTQDRFSQYPVCLPWLLHPLCVFCKKSPEYSGAAESRGVNSRHGPFHPILPRGRPLLNRISSLPAH